MRLATVQEREAHFTNNPRVYGKPAIEQNGLLEGKPIPKQSTRKQLVEYLNALAHKVGIEKTPLNPNGYLATEDNIG
jgi:hypothetical protein